jgi:hypothetical protein
VWKGKVPEQVLLLTHRVRLSDEVFSFLDEDFLPQVGEHYLVFAYHDDSGRLITRTCSRSKSLTEAKEDMRELGIGRKPEKKGVQ